MSGMVGLILPVCHPQGVGQGILVAKEELV